MRRTMIKAALLAFALGLLPAVGSAPPAEAQQEVVEKIRLTHADPNGFVLLLASESPEPPQPGVAPPPANRLLPTGISGLLGYPLDRSLLVKGHPDAVRLLKAAVGVADVPRERLPDGAIKVILQPTHAKVSPLREAVLKLPNPGTAVLDQPKLVLQGKPEWIHRAMREAIRLEIHAFQPKPADK